jgi:5-hydroxytryptamine receptor 7
LVGLLVMPFAMMYELMGQWVLPKAFCDTWTSLDVLLCTASILNLCAISIDRYFVITRPFQYAMKRTPKRMALMIAAVWLSSGVISIPPLFGWKSDFAEGQCAVSQAIGYQFYATIGAFYLPLGVMIFVYYRIYRVSAKIAEAEAKSKPHGEGGGHPHSGMNTPRKNSEENHNAIYPNGAAIQKRDDSTIEMIPKNHTNNHSKKPRVTFNLFKKSSLNKISNSKERKATKTLGVIMGAFTACWLPFFILALVRPFCGSCIPEWLSAVFLWLGYANSFLNPVIYARFNRDFRTPFKEIILLRCTGINIRLRSESYAEQFGGRGDRASTTTQLRDCLKPPQNTVVRYNSDGQTIVRLGNGNAKVLDKVAVASI